MAKLTNWSPKFSIVYDPAKRRAALRTIWKFFKESEYGESIELSGEHQFSLVGYVFNREGFADGEKVVTSKVQSLAHARHKDDESGPQFTFFTENTAYEVSAEDMEQEIADECENLSRIF